MNMKKYLVNPTKTDSLLLALMFVGAGFVLALFSGSLLTTLIRIFGIVLAVYGAYELYLYFGVHRSTNMSPMIIGIPSLILGLFLSFWPQALLNVFPMIAGIILVFNSVIQIQRALVMRSAGMSSWVMTLVLALVMLAAGIFLVVRPGSMINMILRLTGYALIVEGVIIAIDAFTGVRSRNPHQ